MFLGHIQAAHEKGLRWLWDYLLKLAPSSGSWTALFSGKINALDGRRVGVHCI